MINGNEALLLTAFVLIIIGLYTVITKRNLLKILVGVEIIATGVNINFVALSLLKTPGLIDPLPHVLAITSILLDGALVGVGLAITLIVYRKYRTLDIDTLRRLRW